MAVFMAGGAVGFYCGNIKFAESDMKALKPTILPAVPKFLNKIYDACVTSVNKVRSTFSRKVTLFVNIFLEIDSFMQLIFQTNWFRHIFNYALSNKTAEIDKGIVRKTSIWDALIFWLVRSL